jgi:hypothetical protein
MCTGTSEDRSLYIENTTMTMTMTTTLTPEMSTLKTRLKTTWESGDYGVFAKYLEKGALEFFGRLNIPAGTRLLDVACGAGQLTHPAARKGFRSRVSTSRPTWCSRLGPRQQRKDSGFKSTKAMRKIYRIRTRRLMSC